MKKLIIGLSIVVVLLAAVFCLRFILGGPEDTWLCQNGQWIRHGRPAAPQPSANCSDKSPVDFNECAAAGFPIMESYPRQCRDGEGNVLIEELGNQSAKSDLIILDSPREATAVTSPLLIEGRARGNWFFEASFPVKLKDENGKIIAAGIAQAQGDWMTTEFVPFTARLEFPINNSFKANLYLEKDNPSGLPANDDYLFVPLLVEPSLTTGVKVFFNNNNLDPEISCTKVFPVERQIEKTQGVAASALNELLKGPLAAEKDQGYYSNINQGVFLRKLVIENGVAKADFDAYLNEGVAGSCRVGAIRSQIEETLKQFPTVKSVVISIEGNSEDILQP